MQLKFNYYSIILLTFCSVIFIDTPLVGQIIIDENFEDWSKIKTGYIDDLNDGVYGVDFSELKIHNDSRYLYINFTTGIELNLQNSNDIILYIDIDDDNTTGFNINGIGADISYLFGERHGFYYKNGNKTEFFHDDIDLITLPTVSSDHFELAISRTFNIDNSVIELNNQLKILLVQNENGGDKIPNGMGGVSYTLNDERYRNIPFNIERIDPNHLRIMSYNVERDQLFENDAPFQRLIKAIHPDILCFQEIYNHDSKEVYDKIKGYFGGTWYHAKQGNDLIVISKYPIESSIQIGGNGAFVINKGDDKVLIVNAHLYCCEADDRRQDEVDQIMSFIRDSKNQKSAIELDENSPIIILGDMNFVGKNRQRHTLISGDIENESKYGIDFLPDWDDSFFEDVIPITTGFPGTFTWNNDNSSFPKGRLDYMIYSGSVLKKENAYVLYSRRLDNDILKKFNLHASDADNAADHFPIVADFSIKMNVSNSKNSKIQPIIAVAQIFPNPVDDIYNMILSSSKYAQATLQIYDKIGTQHITKNIALNQGENNLSIDVSNLAEGMFIVKIIMGKSILTSSFIKL